MPITSILWPVFAQMGLTLFLYAWLTFARMRAVKDGKADFRSFLPGGVEPPAVARITRNLANQFELPLIFYILAFCLIAFDRIAVIDVIAAWIFVAGRLIHTFVQTRTENVQLRGQVFLINFLAVLVLAGHVVWLAIDYGAR